MENLGAGHVDVVDITMASRVSRTISFYSSRNKLSKNTKVLHAVIQGGPKFELLGAYSNCQHVPKF